MKKAVIIIIILVNIPIFVFFAVRIASGLLSNTQFSSSPASQAQTILKGVQAVQMAGGYEIMIEGPSEYQQLSKDSISLNYGKAYSNIPPECLGASIASPTAACVVLDEAEFGIMVHIDGSTEIHVNTGDISAIISGGRQRASIVITAGQAVLITPNGMVKNIPLDINQFKKSPTPPENLESTQQQP